MKVRNSSLAALAAWSLWNLGSPAVRAQDLAFPAPLVIEGRADRRSAEVEADTEDPFAPPAATTEQLVVEQINVQRNTCSEAGCPLPPLKQVSLLDGVVEDHSTSMAFNEFFSHYDPTDGCSSPQQRATAAGYSGSVGENAAAGQSSVSSVIAGWMASPGHKANILSSKRETGVGYVYQANDLGNVDFNINNDCDCVDVGETCNGGPYLHYWTQLFGSRSNVYPVVIEREKHSVTTGTVNLYVYGPAGVDDMRFSNDGINWSSWQTYATAKSWGLASGDGRRTVFSQVRDGASVFAACDTVWRTGAGGDEIYNDGFDCDGWSGWSDFAN